jgi:hypothetical protein
MTLNRRYHGRPAPFDAALPYTTAAALSLAIGSVIAVPTAFRLGMPAVLLAAGLGRALVASLTRERLREQADAWLAEMRSPNPAVFAWRVEELTGSERKVVGRTLRSFAEEVMRPHRRGAPILNRSKLRSESNELLEIAEALQDPERRASARAVARTRLLITECGSPLNNSARHDELHQALESILADISAPGTTAELRRNVLSASFPAASADRGERRRQHRPLHVGFGEPSGLQFGAGDVNDRANHRDQPQR